MHRKMLEEASPEQLKTFMTEQFDRLKRLMPELYEDMEEDLYEHIHGHHFTEWKYECAVSKLENQDGTKGPHWSVSDVMSVAKAKGMELTKYNEYDLAYAMNTLYSDYFGSVPDGAESYFKMAKAFLDDKDAPEGKAYRYYKAMSE